MTRISQADLRSLTREAASPRLSLFTPTFDGHRDGEAVRIRLKGILRDADDLVAESSETAGRLRGRLEELRRSVSESGFVDPGAQGLAVLASEDKILHENLREAPQPVLRLGSCYHLRPLIASWASRARFFVLAVSRNQVRFFRGNRDALTAVDVPGLPAGISDALDETLENRVSVRSVGSSGGGSRAVFRYGNESSGGERRKEEAIRYLRAIHHALQPFLRAEDAPLVLAGVEYYLPLLREVVSYPGLLDEVVAGSPDRLDESTLHQASWKIVDAWCTRRRQGRLAEFEAKRSRGLTCVSLTDILPSAHDGQIATLLICGDASVWGRYDPAARRVELHEERRPGDEDLLDVATAAAISHDGEVLVVSPEELPDNGSVAAVLRYA